MRFIEEQVAKRGLLQAMEDGTIDEVMEGLAEYDSFCQRGSGYEGWAVANEYRPNDPEAITLWGRLQAVWIVAWNLFGWEEFQARLADARKESA